MSSTKDVPDRLSSMQVALASADTARQCGDLAAQAEAVRRMAKHIGLSREEQNRVAAFRIECMRKAGALLAESGICKGVKSRTLRDFDVAKDQSSRWQQLARIDDDTVHAYLTECADADNGEVTHAGLLRFASGKNKQQKRNAALADTASPEQIQADLSEFVGQVEDGAVERFGCIYADPPWQYGNQGTRAATDNHYPTMPLDDICALPVGQIAAEDAHLHLWTTNAFLFDAKKVIEAWGFEYKSCFVWVKPQMGIGNYWRVSHEFLLFAVRGRCPFQARDKKSWGEFPRSRHSSKPDAVRQMIEEVSPGPRLELFAREAFDGWSAWGNQVQSNLFTHEGS